MLPPACAPAESRAKEGGARGGTRAGWGRGGEARAGEGGGRHTPPAAAGRPPHAARGRRLLARLRDLVAEELPRRAAATPGARARGCRGSMQHAWIMNQEAFSSEPNDLREIIKIQGN